MFLKSLNFIAKWFLITCTLNISPISPLLIFFFIIEIKSLFNVGDQYGFIYIRADKGVNPAELADKIEEKLRKEKGQKEGEEDFYVQTFEQLVETFSTILVVLNAILVIISGISIVVAAVNIMNTMYTAVIDRTKEI